MADGVFTSLESIFQMMAPADLLAAQKLALGKDPLESGSVVRQLQRLLLEGGAGGVFLAQKMLSVLNALRTGGKGGDQDKQAFDRLINFYSTKGVISDVKYPYKYKKDGKDTDGATVDMIVSADKFPAIRGNRDMSIVLSRTPFVSPMARDAQKVELFLNFLPSIVISRCVPYLELEFVFDRGFDKEAPNVLTTASLLKFLMGAVEVKPNTADAYMFSSRAYTDGTISKTAAGMELFTSPQTLINMNPAQPGSRYVDVLDPTRPFASLESVTINVAPTVGIMSYKKATAVIKLHDRSRLAEVADLIQPTTYTRSTVWLTYGWRHPYEPTSDSAAASTYADFINNNMLIKEAYGVKNAGFSFDAVGQVTITLELYTKSVSELRDIKVHDDPEGFKKVAERIAKLAEEIRELRRAYNLDPPSGLNKEIRGSTVLDAAESGTFPDMKPSELMESINALEASLQSLGKIPKGKTDPLIAKLKELYKPGAANKDVFDFKKQTQDAAGGYVGKKFAELQKGADPFLVYKEKYDVQKTETGLTVDHPLINDIDHYNKSDKPSDEVLKDGVKKGIVSFGKLFCVFMAPAMYSLSTIEEFQLLFYTFNDRCGSVSACSIAEFPIDLPVFLKQYKEVIESRGTATMTVEQFIKLAIDAQLNDIRAIGYGFRARGIFKPWDPKGREPTFADEKKQKEMDTAVNSVNAGRGSFQMPQIEVYVEATHAKDLAEDDKTQKPVDLLNYYETQGSSPQDIGFANSKRVIRIHIYDKTANPYRAAGQLLRSASGNGASNFYEVSSDEWVKAHHGDPAAVVTAVPSEGQLKIKEEKGDSGITVTGVQIMDGSDKTRSSNQKIKELVSKMVPSIIYGMNASAVLDASVQTKHDANLSAAQLLGLNSGKKTVATPQGGGMGGLPLKVIPAQLTLRTLGCPLLNYSQLFFVDFNTGTTLDNIYGISGLTHTITPGKFESSLTMAFHDAYGKYEGAPQIVEAIKGMKSTDK